MRPQRDLVDVCFKHSAAHHTAPVVPCSALKAFWSVELDSLKSDSIFWHSIRYEAGRPANVVHYIELKPVVN